MESKKKTPLPKKRVSLVGGSPADVSIRRKSMKSGSSLFKTVSGSGWRECRPVA